MQSKYKIVLSLSQELNVPLDDIQQYVQWYKLQSSIKYDFVNGYSFELKNDIKTFVAKDYLSKKRYAFDLEIKDKLAVQGLKNKIVKGEEFALPTLEYKSRLRKLDYQLKSTKQKIEDKPKPKKPEDIRLELYKLDPDNNEEDRARYNDIRKDWLKSEEGTHPSMKPEMAGYSYDDTANPPRRTVGYGFNMDNKNKNGKNIAKIEWERAFPDENTRPNFDDVYNGQSKLNQDEMNTLFDYSVSSREQRLKRYIGQENWQKLKLMKVDLKELQLVA